MKSNHSVATQKKSITIKSSKEQMINFNIENTENKSIKIVEPDD